MSKVRIKDYPRFIPRIENEERHNVDIKVKVRDVRTLKICFEFIETAAPCEFLDENEESHNGRICQEWPELPDGKHLLTFPLKIKCQCEVGDVIPLKMHIIASDRDNENKKRPRKIAAVIYC